MVEISFIVPVYNTSEYLVQCLDSLVAQSEIDKEIIIVNDGSTDNSLEIILDYVQRYEYISFVDQVNQGLSAARNAGIERAVGEYLWFVDSDDYLYGNDVAAKLYQQGKKHDLEMVFGRNLRGTMDGGTKIGSERFYRIKQWCGKVMSAREYWLETIKANCFWAPVWRGIYRRSYIIENDLYFIVGRIHEDEPHTLKALTVSNTAKVMQVEDIVYVYRINNAGIVNNTSLKSLYNSAKGNIQNYAWVSVYVKEQSLDSEFINIIYNMINWWLTAVMEKGRKLAEKDKKEFNKFMLSELWKLFCNKNVVWYNKKKIFKIMSKTLRDRY